MDSRIKVYVMEKCRSEYRKVLEERFGSAYVFTYTEDPGAPVPPHTEVIIGGPTLEQLHAAKELKWLQMTWAGTERYTRSRELGAVYDFPEGVILTNASGAFGSIIAEHVLGGILTLYRNFPVYLEQSRQRVWKDAGAERSLEGQTALILGCGDIGCHTAKRLQAFDCRCIGIRKRTDILPAYFDEVYDMTALERLLPIAGLVIVCLPNTEETEGCLYAECDAANCQRS